MSHVFLMSSQSKIKALEEKLKEEKHYRKVMQDRAAEVCSSFVHGHLFCLMGTVSSA